MTICKLNLDNQTLIIIITAIILGINFRSSFKNVNYHMDCGNFYSLTYDPFLILIKNILCLFFFLAYFIELKINKVNDNKKKDFEKKTELNDLEEEVVKKAENIGELESLVLSNQIYNEKDMYLFVLKVFLIIICIYLSEEIHFIVINNHVLDRLICSIRNLFALLSILIFSAILYHKKFDKKQIKNFFNNNKHQVMPLIIICLLSLFLLLYDAITIPRFKIYYNINLFYYIICCLLIGLELTLTKYLLEILYINKFLILGIKGLLGTVVFIIINIKINNNNFYKFIDDIFSFQYTLKPEEFHLIYKIIYVLTLIIFQYLKIIIIDKYSEMHFLSTMMITDIFCFPLYCFERFVIQNFNISTIDTFFINVSISIINTILMLVFNEILELNFCGLNKNLRKNIIYRHNSETSNILIVSDDNASDDGDE